MSKIKRPVNADACMQMGADKKGAYSRMTIYQPNLDFDPEPETELKPGIFHDSRDHMLMWFDDSKLPLQEKILRAASYYYQKFGLKPNLVEIHTNTPAPTDWRVLAENSILIRFDNRVLVNHLYIGQEEKIS